MKKTRTLAALLAPLILLVACGNDPDPTDSTMEGREITYTVNSKVSHVSLANDAEWDALLDRFCDYTEEGLTVSFYNSHPSNVHPTKSSSVSKEATSISTTDRVALKRWMKEMEKEGKTVTVVYNEKDGTWNGTAYANGPLNQEPDGKKRYSGRLVLTSPPNTEDIRPFDEEIWALEVSEDSLLLLENDGLIPSFTLLIINGTLCENGDTVTLSGIVEACQSNNGTTYMVLHLSHVDEADIVGQWHYYSMTTLSFYTDGSMILGDMSTFTPESVGNTIHYEFRADGTMSYIRHNGTPQSREGTWSLSADGELCCEYFDGGDCWTVEYLTNGIMVLSRTSTDNGGTYYQMELHATPF